MSQDPNKSQEPVIFTEMEQIGNNKTTQQLSQAFLQQHVEITAPAGSDLAQMIRQEKQMYASLAIQFAVNYFAAQKKRSEQ